MSYAQQRVKIPDLMSLDELDGILSRIADGTTLNNVWEQIKGNGRKNACPLKWFQRISILQVLLSIVVLDNHYLISQGYVGFEVLRNPFIDINMPEVPI